MTLLIVEGESDRGVIEVLAERLGMPAPRILAVGGSKGARRASDEHAGERLVGLVDANERRDFERVLDTVFVCDPDLEAELVRALGVDGVEAIIAGQGELDSFRTLQRQPAQRLWSTERQLMRFFSARSGNKLRYGRLLAAAVPLDRVPAPLAGLLSVSTSTSDGSGDR